MRINTNISALTSYHSLARVTGKLEKSVARLSSGLKIETAADDAAGLAVTEKMHAQIRGLNQAYANAQDGISLLQTADGALGEVQSILQRMRELSVQSANDTLTANDREYIQLEIDQLAKQIDDISTQTQFNKKKILNGDSSVLWSTSTTDINVIVNGSLRWKDQFGTVQSADGNYKITFNTKANGTENVQKSNILTMKHGTVATGLRLEGAASGLFNVEALNMVEGEYRLETREVPFGGIRYYEGGNLVSKTEVGAELSATTTPSVVAPGDYEVRLSNKVPMMADFTDALAKDAVTGINISSLNTTRDFDAQFRTTVNATGSGATQTLYDDAAGRAATVGINTNTNANVFTRYEVANVDARDTLAGQLQIQESYKASSNAVVGATLTYNSGTQADPTKATFTYSTVASEIDYTSTWRTTSDKTITATLNYTVQTGVDPITNDPIYGQQTDAININIVAGSDIETISNRLTTELATGYGISVIHNDTAGTTSFSITNQSNIFGTHGNVTVSFSGDLATELNMARTVTAGNNSDFSTGKDWETSRSVKVDAGKSIADVANALSGINGISATVDGTDDARIVLTQNGTGTLGNNAITFAAAGTDNAFNELGISGKSIAQTAGSTANGNFVMNGKEVTFTTNFSNQSISGVATALGAALTAQAAGATTSAISKTGELSHFNVVNNSIYDITVSGGVVDELSNGGTLAANRGAASADTAGVYDNVMHTVSVAGGRLSDIQSKLNTTINNMLTGDGITANNGAKDLVSRSADGQNTTLTLNNTAVTGAASTKYNIELSDVSGTGALGEMWKTNKNATLGSNIISTGIAFQWTHDVNGAGKDADMATVFAALNNNGTNPSLVNLAATWVDDPTQPDAHWGTMRITNNSNDASGDTRRVYQIRNNGADRGENFLNSGNLLGTRHLTNGTVNLEAGASVTSNHWQTKDAVQITVTAQGNYNDGRTINRTATIGAAGAAAYGDKGNNNRDWLWEGDTTEGGRNADKMNAQFGKDISSDFYTNFSVPDGTTVSNIDKGDSWILFTQAHTTAGDATQVAVKVGDSRTGNQTEVTYAFNKGALSGGHTPTINQMLHLNKTTIELLQHHIEFGAGADTDGTTFQYGERGNAGNVEDWKLDNNDNVKAWYSHAYYGDNATSFFQSGRSADEIIHSAEVNRMNDINASIMFTMNNGKLTAHVKGFNDTTGGKIDDVAYELTGADMNAISHGGEVDILGIKFTNLHIDTNALYGGDKFVINVAAAAKIYAGDLNLNAAGNYRSAANIAVTGDPFQQGEGRGGSTAQYRVREDAENGQQLNMLGYFIHPANGSNDVKGIGYYDGSFILDVDGGGFKDGSTVGRTDADDAGAYTIHAEINYQGNTNPSAGALVTSGYFQKLEYEPGYVIADFVKGIGYANYKYRVNDKGVYEYIDDAGAQEYTDLNASVVFDVMKIEGEVITFRAQARVIDKNGNQYYAEDEEIRLSGRANTSKDTSTTPPTTPAVVNDPVILFKDSAFGGLYLDEVTLGSTDIWTEGDRFTVTLTASGYENGRSMDDQNNDPALAPTTDEINIFSDNRGSTMPNTFRFNDGVLDNNQIELGIYQLANNLVMPDSDHYYNDQVMDGKLVLKFGDYHPKGDITIKHAATFNVEYKQGIDAGVAHYYSNVRDIAQFYDKNGRYILEGENEQLVIRQGDNEARVNVTSGMELGDLTRSMSEAVWRDLLHQYEHELKGEGDLFDPAQEKPHMVAEEDKYNIVKLVNNVAGDGSTNTVVGTVIAHSVLSGKDAALEFSGSEDMAKAFNFTTIQQGTSAEFTANVADAHTGNTVTSGTKVVAGTVNSDLIHEAVSLNIDGDMGILRSVYDKTSGTFKLDVKDQFSHNVHLADNTTTLQIGANEGEDMYLSLGDVSSESLGVGHLSLRTREGAARAITQVDNAISIVSKQRAIIGAQINRLEHTMANLANSSINLENSMSRIKDADIAKEMMNFAKFSVISNAASSILAQANQMSRNVLAMIG